MLGLLPDVPIDSEAETAYHGATLTSWGWQPAAIGLGLILEALDRGWSLKYLRVRALGNDWHVILGHRLAVRLAQEKAHARLSLKAYAPAISDSAGKDLHT